MKMILAIALSLIMLISTISITVFADEAEPFTVSGAIGNDMVLQRDAKNKIWGWSDKKGEKITVSFKGQTVETTVDENGEWCAVLPEMAMDKTENDLTVTMGDFTKTFTGILVGDVYLVGGQSNAERALNTCGNEYSNDEIKAWVDETGEMIRFFEQKNYDATINPDVMNAPQPDVLKGKKWKKETFSSAKNLSAIGFFFAHKVVKDANVPVGIIMVASSGSPVSQLMSKEASEKAKYFRYENNIPVSGMYNALMHPFINTSIKAMLFYQGESEMDLAIQDYGKYNEYVNIYVEDLREKMNQDFPFYYVQLSSHIKDKWNGVPEQRAVQFDGLSVIKNSAMVVSMDHGVRPANGDTDMSHPNYKKPIGERLADLALCRLYGIGNESYVTSPMPEYAYVTDQGVVIKFKNVGDGLQKIGQHEKLSGFKIDLGVNKRNVEAEIIGKDEVLLKEERVASQIKGIAYGIENLAFVDYPEGNGDLKYVANLGNSNGLPAPTFKLEVYKSLDEALGKPEATPEITPETAPETTPEVAPEVTPENGGSNANVSGENNNSGNGTDNGTWIGVAVVGVAVVAALVAVVIAVKKKKK